MKLVRLFATAILFLSLPVTSMAQTAEPLDKLIEKLPIEKIMKDAITADDVDMLANVFKSALAGKEAVVPEEFTQRIAGKAEKLRVELTPIFTQLIDEMVKSIKLEAQQQRL
jgi:histone H3/H4